MGFCGLARAEDRWNGLLRVCGLDSGGSGGNVVCLVMGSAGPYVPVHEVPAGVP